MAKKPVKYPKKLRVKMEKVREARDERAAKAGSLEKFLDDTQKILSPLWHELLVPGETHLMHTRFSDDQQSMETNFRLKARPRADHRSIIAPWLRDESPASL